MNLFNVFVFFFVCGYNLISHSTQFCLRTSFLLLFVLFSSHIHQCNETFGHIKLMPVVRSKCKIWLLGV